MRFFALASAFSFFSLLYTITIQITQPMNKASSQNCQSVHPVSRKSLSYSDSWTRKHSQKPLVIENQTKNQHTYRQENLYTVIPKSLSVRVCTIAGISQHDSLKYRSEICRKKTKSKGQCAVLDRLPFSVPKSFPECEQKYRYCRETQIKEVCTYLFVYLLYPDIVASLPPRYKVTLLFYIITQTCLSQFIFIS